MLLLAAVSGFYCVLTRDATNQVMAMFQATNFTAQSQAVNSLSQTTFIFFQWVPMILFPAVAALTYSTSDQLPTSCFLRLVRRQAARLGGPQPMAPGLNLFHPYLTLVLFSACMANQRNEWFYFALCGVIAAALWTARPRRFSNVVWVSVFLVVAKLANVSVPLVLKHVVDQLDPGTAVLAMPFALLVAYGALRFSTTAFAELRDIIFVRVTQRAVRRIALDVFRHLHSLSLRFHLERQTGGVSRDIERGTRGISTLLSYMLFSIIPVILEFALVAAVLLGRFDWRFAAVTFGAVIVYIGFTIAITEWRTAIRREANELDSRANSRAIDSLLNYETVKYFNNEEFEARRYDENLRNYEGAAVQTESSLGLLNIGQSLIIAAAVTVLMLLAAQGVVTQTLTIGDLVLVNALLIQLYIPLNHLGMVYREIKQSLIDMDRMFRLLGENREVEDRPGAQPLRVGTPAVRFENVDFSYEPRRQILHHIWDEPIAQVVGPKIRASFTNVCGDEEQRIRVEAK